MALRRLAAWRLVCLSNVRIMSNGSNVGGSAVRENKSKTGDNTTYKVPEYFSYNENSFYDFECELDKYRLEQPTASSQNNT